MTTAHQVVGWVAVGATLGLLLAGAWSWAASRRTAGEIDHRFAVDRLVLVTELAIVVAIAAGGLVLASGGRPADLLHLLYGALGVTAIPLGVAIGARQGGGAPQTGGAAPARRRRDAWTTVAAAILLAIELRLFLTG